MNRGTNTNVIPFEKTGVASAVWKELHVNKQDNLALELAAMLGWANTVEELLEIWATREKVKNLVDQLLTLSEEVNTNLNMFNSQVLNLLPQENLVVWDTTDIWVRWEAANNEEHEFAKTGT